MISILTPTIISLAMAFIAVVLTATLSKEWPGILMWIVITIIISVEYGWQYGLVHAGAYLFLLVAIPIVMIMTADKNKYDEDDNINGF